MSEAWSAGIFQVCHVDAAMGWLMLWSLRHVGHSLLHGLQHLGLHDQYLLQCWWWRRVGNVVVVLMRGTIVSVGHLMIVKRYETEIKIEIKDS
jgi:hypothetical protein